MGIDALARDAFIEESVSKEFVTRLIIDITGKRTDNQNNNPLLDPNICQTNGVYYVQYYPKPGPYYTTFKFLVSGDVFGRSKGRVRVKDWNDLLTYADKDERVKWFLENTTISEFDFKIAEANKLARIPVIIDLKKYSEKLGTIKHRNPETEEYVLRAKNYKSSGGKR